MKRTNYPQLFRIFLTLALALIVAKPAYAHGVVIDYTVTETGEIQLQATFDTGELMSGAQVTVYAPDNPATPWLTGTADEEGRFVFTVDPSKPGIWDVQFRKAGHGEIVHISIEQVTAEAGTEAELPEEAVEEPNQPEAEAAPEVEAEVEAQPAEAEKPTTSDPVEQNETPAEATEAEATVAPVVSQEETKQEVVDQVDDKAETEAQADHTDHANPTVQPRVVVSGGSSNGLSTLQILLMSGSVIWGFIGTALYFSSRRA